METQFEKHISKRISFIKEEKLLIACSGGVDSMILTHLCQQAKLNIALAHCNFNLRGKESDEDELFIREYAKEQELPLYVAQFDTQKIAKEKQLSIQMAARELRYDWFKELSKKENFSYVLTAHHADDNLETFLINLSRGTGIDGLTGIPEVNDIYVRPLLPFSRKEIIHYAQHKKINWREDSSNSSTKYLRNKLRHDVIPELKKVNTTFLQNFTTTLDNLQKQAAFLEEQITRIKKETFKKISVEPLTYSIKIDQINEQIVSVSNLYYLFKSYGFTTSHDIENLLVAQSGKYIESSTHKLLKNRSELLLSERREDTKEIVLINEIQKTIEIKNKTLVFSSVDEIGEKNKETIYIDKNKINYPLTVRNWRKGDYFYPLGMKGKKKLSKYFKDEKASLLEKEQTLLLCDNNDAIIWILNYRADNRFKITAGTKHILKITLNQ